MAHVLLDVDLLRRRDPATTQRFMAELRRCARYYLRRQSDIDHVAADALAELFAKLERGDQPASVTQWVATAASNATKRRLTHRRRASDWDAFAVLAPKKGATLSETLRHREQLDCVAKVLAQLPETTREAVIATSLEGRHTGSIADELGVRPGTLRKELTRARQMLRRELTDQEKLERLRELARERRRELAAQGHSPPPRLARPGSSPEDSSTSER
jgi:RNA polymerase sigma factor (sigma-70 family)